MDEFVGAGVMELPQLPAHLRWARAVDTAVDTPPDPEPVPLSAPDYRLTARSAAVLIAVYT